jgi:hypothetical protein
MVRRGLLGLQLDGLAVQAFAFAPAAEITRNHRFDGQRFGE